MSNGNGDGVRSGALATRESMINTAAAAVIHSLGEAKALLEDKVTTDIWRNAHENVIRSCNIGGHNGKTDIAHDEQAAMQLASAIAPFGQHQQFSESRPLLEAFVPGHGARFTAALTRKGVMWMIRKPIQRPVTLEDNYLKTGIATRGQIAAIRTLVDKRKNILVVGPMGSGKALDDATLVLTPEGKRRIDVLKIGDQVFSTNGSIARVRGVYPQGELQGWRVTTNDGLSAICCEDHLWPVRSVGSNDPFTPRKTKEIRGSTAPFELALLQRVSTLPVALDDDPYLVGAELGRSWNYSVVGGRGARRERGNLIGWLSQGSHEQRLALLQGIGDECLIHANDAFVFAIPHHAIPAVRELVASLGGTAFLAPTHASLQLLVRMPKNAPPVRRPTAATAQAFDPRRTIASIEPVSPRSMRCITVDAPDHCFLIDGYLVTHNTTLTNALLAEFVKAFNGQDRFIIIEDTPELVCPEDNRVELLVDKKAQLDFKDLIEFAMRCGTTQGELHIIIGELRRAGVTALEAWNTGHSGNCLTLHGRSPAEAMRRFEHLLWRDNYPIDRREIMQTIHAIIVISRHRLSRKIDHVVEIVEAGADGYVFKDLTLDDEA